MIAHFTERPQQLWQHLAGGHLPYLACVAEASLGYAIMDLMDRGDRL